MTADYSKELLDQLPYSDFMREVHKGMIALNTDQLCDALGHYITKDRSPLKDSGIVPEFRDAIRELPPSDGALASLLVELIPISENQNFQSHTERDNFLSLLQGVAFILADREGFATRGEQVDYEDELIPTLPPYIAGKNMNLVFGADFPNDLRESIKKGYISTSHLEDAMRALMDVDKKRFATTTNRDSYLSAYQGIGFLLYDRYGKAKQRRQ